MPLFADKGMLLDEKGMLSDDKVRAYHFPEIVAIGGLLELVGNYNRVSG